MRTKLLLVIAALGVSGCYRVQEARPQGQCEPVAIRLDITTGRTCYLSRNTNGELVWVAIPAPTGRY